MTLLAVAIPPIAGAASASSICPLGEVDPVCNLVITAPETVLTFQTFTVQVAVSAGEGGVVPNTDACAKATVSLEVSEDGPYFKAYTASTSLGIATFNISVPEGGFYDLRAYVLSAATAALTAPNCGYNEGSGNFTAVFIPATQPLAPCPDNVFTCLQVWSSTGTAATLFADTGAFVASFVPFIAAEGCDTTGPVDPNGVLNFTYDGTSPKTIVFALDALQITKGIGLYNVCWRSTNPFTQLGGTAAPSVGGLFTGYLPNCKKVDVGPCVLFRKSNQFNVGFFGVLAPPSDPKGYVR